MADDRHGKHGKQQQPERKRGSRSGDASGKDGGTARQRTRATEPGKDSAPERERDSDATPSGDGRNPSMPEAPHGR